MKNPRARIVGFEIIVLSHISTSCCPRWGKDIIIWRYLDVYLSSLWHDTAHTFIIYSSVPCSNFVLFLVQWNINCCIWSLLALNSHLFLYLFNYHIKDGILLLKVNRLLQAGGYFAWAARPVYKHEALLEEQWEGKKNTETVHNSEIGNSLSMSQAVPLLLVLSSVKRA